MAISKPTERSTIAFIGQPGESFDFPFSSIAIWTREVARRLALSFKTIVYAADQSEQDGSLVHRRTVTARSPWFSKGLSVFDWLSSHPIFWFRLFNSVFYHPRLAFRLARDLRKERCDVVHLHNYFQAAPLVRLLNPQIKIILHMHCEWLTGLDYDMVARRLSKVDMIVGCSDFITGKIRRRFPQFASRCHTLYNGVDVDRFTPKAGTQEAHAGKKQLLYVGRLSPEKGLHVLIDAFEKVSLQYPEAELKIVGRDGSQPMEWLSALGDPLVDPKTTELGSFYPGSYVAHLKQRILPRFSSRISFTGYIPHSELAAHYARADVLVSPSLSEAMPMTPIEAMAAGVAVVATSVGGTPESVEHGKTGLLVQPGDASALAEAILALFDDDGLRQRLGACGRRRVLEQFTWERIVDRYRTLCALALHESIPENGEGVSAAVQPAQADLRSDAMTPQLSEGDPAST